MMPIKEEPNDEESMVGTHDNQGRAVGCQDQANGYNGIPKYIRRQCQIDLIQDEDNKGNKGIEILNDNEGLFVTFVCHGQ
jgi:hypothetical protein